MPLKKINGKTELTIIISFDLNHLYKMTNNQFINYCLDELKGEDFQMYKLYCENLEIRGYKKELISDDCNFYTIPRIIPKIPFTFEDYEKLKETTIKKQNKKYTIIDVSQEIIKLYDQTENIFINSTLEDLYNNYTFLNNSFFEKY